MPLTFAATLIQSGRVEMPLCIRERWNRLELVDARGRIIAVSLLLMPWAGVSEKNDPQFIRANFERMASTLNAAASCTSQAKLPILQNFPAGK